MIIDHFKFSNKNTFFELEQFFNIEVAIGNFYYTNGFGKTKELFKNDIIIKNEYGNYYEIKEYIKKELENI